MDTHTCIDENLPDYGTRYDVDGRILTGSATPGWIRYMRTQLGMTQTELAEALGVSRQTVSSWETGRKGFHEKLVYLALQTLME